MNSDVRKKVEAFFEGRPERRFAKGDMVAFAHEDHSAVLYLREGVVEQYDITPEGNKVTVNMFKPPAFFPMSWALNGTRNTYFFSALTDIRAAEASPEETKKFLEENADVAVDLLSRVYKGTDGLLRRLVLASSGLASTRLIFELIIEAYRFGTPQKDGRVLVKVQRGSLAARAGLARETVSRELHRLEAAGLAELVRGGVLVYIETLEARLEFSI